MPNPIRRLSIIAVAAVLAGCASQASDTQTSAQSAGEVQKRTAQASGHPDELLWGDIHLHTEYSMDANIFGAKLSPDDAYRFAKGAAVTGSNGLTAKLDTPLDFLMVSDHSDNLGSIGELRDGRPSLLENPILVKWREALLAPDRAARADLEPRITMPTNPSELDDDSLRQTYWQRIIESAERAYEPGKFTSLIGFEWTAQNGGENLHRVVMFRDGAGKTSKTLPLSAARTDDPMDLWAYLQNYEDSTGGKAMAVAHNGNLSNGAMFPLDENEFGKPMTAEYVRKRARWEPVYEITQIKGDGETHPFLSSEDEFADYETWDKIDFAGVKKTTDMLAGEYARSALLRGLELEKRLGTNPYKFGVVGSTDAHTALAAVDEDNFWGKHSAEMEPSPTRWKDAVGGRDGTIVPGWLMASSGYAAVWARENTREEIWDAFKRREVYASTGPRIKLRFFGGWDFDDADMAGGDIATTGYAKGVPMGGNMPKPGSNIGSLGAPSFMVQALRDPMGATLDRVQVVKGWLDANGKTHEKVYDVVWSQPGTRKLDSNGKLPMIKGNVDVANAKYDNSPGAAQLMQVWSDPDFDPSERAFYYVRVLQVPTPRWTAYDAKKFGVTMPDHVPMITQERAYSSPIWYNPPA